jgi:hypothetical protein
VICASILSDPELDAVILTPARKTHCLRGHRYTEWNTLWSRGQSGTLQRSCKRCRKARLKLKYQTNPEWRTKERERARRNKQKRAANLIACAISSVSSD